jgi:Uma2 family endonuclease
MPATPVPPPPSATTGTHGPRNGAAPAGRRRFTRAEFYRLIDSGFFEAPERLTLEDGEIVFKMAQNQPHRIAVRKADDALQAAFGGGWCVFPSGPIDIHEYEDPEPDLSVASGSIDDYPEIPRAVSLAVEISDTTLTKDRGRKASLYAKAGIPDYWIVNLRERCVEVHREPAQDPKQPFGWRYTLIRIVPEGGTVSPLAKPEAAVRVADLLPRAEVTDALGAAPAETTELTPPTESPESR